MLADTTILVLSAILTWLMLLTSSLLRTRGWKSGGLKRALGNRDDLPAPTPVAGRADRAARNMLENLVLFIALLAAVHFAGKANAQTQLGANLFFWSRAAYWPCYLGGVVYLRTVSWFGGIIGLAFIAVALW